MKALPIASAGLFGKRHIPAGMTNTIILLTLLFGLLAIYFICRHMIRQTSQPPVGTPKQLRMRADMDDIDQLSGFITEAGRQAGLTDHETKRLRLALEEAVANIINYSQATYIALDATNTGTQLKVCVTDDGVPFDPTAGSATDMSLPPDQRPPGGLGIMFLHQMTDALDYQRTDNLNMLTLYKNI